MTSAAGFSEGEKGVTFAVRVVPRARRNQISGRHGDAIKIRLTAPPVEGAANAALCAFLAECLGVRQQAVEILSGHNSRAKIVRVVGLGAQQIQERLLAD